MSAEYYFAYGSNLSFERLRRRVPSARPLGIGILEAHRLVFHKAGGDGSAKCDAFYTGDRRHRVLGRIYRIDPNERHVLDRAENLGVGYEMRHLDIAVEGHGVLTVFSYHALRINPNDVPYDWYRYHVEVGAAEAGLPEAYRREIAQVPVKEDLNPDRASREWSHYPEKEEEGP